MYESIHCITVRTIHATTIEKSPYLRLASDEKSGDPLFFRRAAATYLSNKWVGFNKRVG